MCTSMSAQTLTFPAAKFKAGDAAEWKNADYDDTAWQTLDVSRTWDSQGIPSETNFGWYRFHVRPTKAMLDNSDLKEYIVFDLGTIDDVDEAYLNGVLIGKTGNMPGDKGQYSALFNVPRKYIVKANDKNIKWDQDNVLAVRCYSGNAPGGMYGGHVNVSVPDRIDGGSITFSQDNFDSMPTYTVTLNESYPSTLSGTLTIDVTDIETGKLIDSTTKKVSATKNKPARLTFPYDKKDCLRVKATFTDKKSGKQIKAAYTPKYILTPKAPETPRFNTTTVYGVRPGSPIHFRFGVACGCFPCVIDVYIGISVIGQTFVKKGFRA